MILEYTSARAESASRKLPDRCPRCDGGGRLWSFVSVAPRTPPSSLAPVFCPPCHGTGRLGCDNGPN